MPSLDVAAFVNFSYCLDFFETEQFPLSFIHLINVHGTPVMNLLRGRDTKVSRINNLYDLC